MYYFLIGFMAAGKTTLGKKIAAEKGWTFVDLDAYIEQKMGISISHIFAEKSEPFFRQIEAETLRSLIAEVISPCIIACGGGTPLFFDNHALMQSVGKSIYLKAKPEMLAERLLQDRDKRPLLANIAAEDLLLFIQKKLMEREAEYEKANEIIDVSDENALYNVIAALHS